MISVVGAAVLVLGVGSVAALGFLKGGSESRDRAEQARAPEQEEARAGAAGGHNEGGPDKEILEETTLSQPAEERSDEEEEAQPATEQSEGKKVQPGPDTAAKGPDKGFVPEKQSGPAVGYNEVQDPTGSLRVEVPPGWGVETAADSEGAGGPNSWSYYAGTYLTSSITIARSFDDWYQGGGAEQGSGAYLVASKTLAQEYTDDELIFSLLFASKANVCTAGPYEDFDRPPYFGKIQTWYDCGGYDNTTFVVAAAPRGRECVVVLLAKLAPGADEADRKAVQHILDTFEVDCAGIA